MSVPKSVVRFKRGNVVYTSSVDRASYTILELTRAALRDVGKFAARKANSEAMKLPGLDGHKRVKGNTSAFKYKVPWAKDGLPHLEIGIIDNTWYGVQQELGTSRQPKRGILRNAVHDNIAQIVAIESQYLSALEDEARALALISEEEYHGGGED